MADPQNPNSGGGIDPILGALLGIGGAVTGRIVGNRSAQNAVPPELSQLLQMGVQRAQYQNPLFQATNQGIYSMLPNYATQGTSLGSSLPPMQSMPQTGGSGLGGNLLSALGGAAAGSALTGLSNGGSAIPFADIINGLKRLFGHGGGRNTVQGDQPYSGGALTGPDTTRSGYEHPPDVSWRTGLPWEQTFLPSDPGFYTGVTYPSDPSGGTGVGPGMQDYYRHGGGLSDVDPTHE